MKKARDHSQSEEVHLYPQERNCPGCQQPRAERYRKRRWIITLRNELKVISHWLECRTPGCTWRGARWRPEQEDVLALRGYNFGLDVVARIGELRYREHQTLRQIQQELPCSISLKEVELLSEVFLALVNTHARDDEKLLEELRVQGSIILALDGVQPEKGNETLYLLRDLVSGRVLVARNLLSSACAEIEALIDEVLRLEVKIAGVVSDKQESLCLAIERKLPGVPHQLCHFHYLRDAALPVCEADRQLKKELKQKVRGMREVERKVATRQTTAATVVRDYCLALRTVLRADGHYPLEPAGLTLWERLQQVKASLERALEQREDPQLRRLLKLVAVSDQYAEHSARLETAFGWVHQIARLLESAEPRTKAEQHLSEYVASLSAGADTWLGEIVEQLRKETGAFLHGLFVYREEVRLPRTNNELETFIGELKKGHRHVTGRKNTTEFILREGRAVAIFYSLPAPADWVTTFAQLDLNHFQQTLADLRRSDERSKAWQARRDLSSYLHRLEERWSVSDGSSCTEQLLQR
jgi:hypothetical protein